MLKVDTNSNKNMICEGLDNLEFYLLLSIQLQPKSFLLFFLVFIALQYC